MIHSAIDESSHSPHAAPAKAYNTSPVIVAFTLGVLICLIVGVCLIYFCRCFVINCIYTRNFRRPTVNNLLRQIHSPNHAADSAATTPIPGIDPKILQIFPTFHYASVKEFQKKNNNNKSYSLECAICLLEFEEDSFLRLLTFCCHVFHQECIDLWLESHKTCPVCRTDLDSSSKEKQYQEQNQENNPNNNETRIDVRDEDEDRDEDEEDRRVSRRREFEEEEGVIAGEGDQEERRFSKSHSTGHSFNKEDRYTLRLPEHVKMKLMRGYDNNHTSKSCGSYWEMTISSSSSKP